jgi:Cu-Zn family superoxide dismutase
MSSKSIWLPIVAASLALAPACTRRHPTSASDSASRSTSSNNDNVAVTDDSRAPAVPEPGASGERGAAVDETQGAATAPNGPAPSEAFATVKLEPRSGSNASGSAELTTTGDGKSIMITASLAGLAPGEHGIHVHENGDCSAADASSAGGHFNPTGAEHGGPQSPQHHAGDFGNVRADKNGNAVLTLTIPRDGANGLDLATTLVGKSLVVHEKIDDFTTQPSGNSGGRIACGVIVRAEGAMTH